MKRTADGSGGAGGGPDCYKKLWRLMFDKFTREYDLHNLIWVYSGMGEEWYPGDAYVDIIGEDIYPAKSCISAQGDKFLNALDYTDTVKPVMLSESGFLPEPENAARDGIYWLGCVLWGGGLSDKGAGLRRAFRSSLTRQCH